MQIRFHKGFRNTFKTRILPNKNLVDRFYQRLNKFIKDPGDPILFDHALSGDKVGFRSFSVTDNVRVVYKETKEGIRLYDIGSHDQVY
jgi:mRNA-degrading endonuclease YafQ of YafQ-DinJ toxin-antitoxin module